VIGANRRAWFPSIKRRTNNGSAEVALLDATVSALTDRDILYVYEIHIQCTGRNDKGRSRNAHPFARTGSRQSIAVGECLLQMGLHMSAHADKGLGAIEDLTHLSEILPEAMVTGIPQGFDDLFSRTDLRLLQSNLHNTDVVVAFRHNDLRELAAHPSIGMLTEHPYLHRLYGSSVFATNPPRHGPMRQVIARPLSPKHIQHLSEVARYVARELLDEVSGKGDLDFCTQFSDRLAGRFWGALFTMTGAEIERMIDTAHAITLSMRLAPTPDEIKLAQVAMDTYLDTVASAVDRALEKGGNELLESMSVGFNAISYGDKPHHFGEMIAANVFDGVHTASLAISNSLYALLVSPDYLRAVRADIGLAQAAAYEGLRLWSPLIHSPRCVLHDLEYAGTYIPQGTQIRMLLAAGNRDPQVFERPNHYDLCRRHLHQTTFGGGVHICPGRHVVEMLARIGIETVLAPGVQIDLTDRPTWLSGSELRQLTRMNITIERDTGQPMRTL
jgi:cytochrome P450